MDKENLGYKMPNIGCMIGMAYQVMVNQLNEALINTGLCISSSEYLILRVLYEKEGLQQCEIASVLGKDNAAVCRSVKGLVAKDLIRTESVSHKCLKVFLTDTGRRAERAIMNVAETRHDRLASVLSSEGINTLENILKKIISL